MVMAAYMDIGVVRVFWAHSECIAGGTVGPKRSPESKLTPKELARLAMEQTTRCQLREIFEEMREEEEDISAAYG